MKMLVSHLCFREDGTAFIELEFEHDGQRISRTNDLSPAEVEQVRHSLGAARHSPRRDSDRTLDDQ